MHKKINFQGSCKFPQAHKKVCDENERNKQTNKEEEENNVCVNVTDRRRAFIGHVWQNSMIDCKEPQVDDC